jgi:hypothetical protein
LWLFRPGKTNKLAHSHIFPGTNLLAAKERALNTQNN